MKPSEELTDEELRIEIAEWCGWKRNPALDYACIDLTTRKEVTNIMYSLDQRSECVEGLPNYPQDLNAMWEAEEKLSEPLWTNYCLVLRKYFTKFPCRTYNELHATAKQRAIAFVKTIREIKRK